MLDHMDISDGQIGVIQPDEMTAFDGWSACDHEGAAQMVDDMVRELVESDRLTVERAQHLFVQAIEMSYDSCCTETQLLTLGVAAGARVLAHRKAGETQLAGLWLARVQNAQRLLSELLGPQS